MDMFKNACRLHTQFAVGRYLMSNAHGRWDGAEKAQRHLQLCQFYVAAVRGFDDEQKVLLESSDFKAVHKETQKLTDHLDEVIGFPLDSTPDYEKLEPLFFERFHALALQALGIEDAIVLPRKMDEDLYYVVGGAMGAQSPEQCARADVLWDKLVARSDRDSKPRA